jgi:hydrogenase expression/formation protein HypC
MCLGIPGQIVEITDRAHCMAIVDISGIKRPISLACIVDDEHPIDACVGDWVIVHVGFAMSRIDATAAAATLELLHSLGEIEDELQAIRASGGSPGTPSTEEPNP